LEKTTQANGEEEYSHIYGEGEMKTIPLLLLP
jgi:hypothetical protein